VCVRGTRSTLLCAARCVVTLPPRPRAWRVSPRNIARATRPRDRRRSVHSYAIVHGFSRSRARRTRKPGRTIAGKEDTDGTNSTETRRVPRPRPRGPTGFAGPVPKDEEVEPPNAAGSRERRTLHDDSILNIPAVGTRSPDAVAVSRVRCTNDRGAGATRANVRRGAACTVLKQRNTKTIVVPARPTYRRRASFESIIVSVQVLFCFVFFDRRLIIIDSFSWRIKSQTTYITCCCYVRSFLSL